MCNLKDLKLTKEQMLILKSQIETELAKPVFIKDPTGLEWDVEIIKGKSWFEAMEIAKSKGLRLPTFKELMNLFDYETGKPISGFEDMKDLRFWSSSSIANNSDYAWIVNFNHGYVDANFKNYNYAVRCVRA